MAGRRNHYGDGGFSRGPMPLSRTLRELREMGAHVAQAAKEALKQGVDIVVADAKSRCPVKTGRLRDSIKAEPKNDGAAYLLSANAYSEVTKSVENEDGGYDEVTMEYYYGGRVEFDPAINKPFMYPAMDAHRNEIRETIKDAISNAIRRGP